jgi:hypothetical protein
MTRKTRPIQYNSNINIRANPGVIAEIHAAARRRDTRPSEWVRNAISLALQLERPGETTECKHADR